MTITLYVDFENEEVYSEAEYEDTVLNIVEEAFHGYSDYCYDFDEWLNNRGYTPSVVFQWGENEKEAIATDYKEYADMAVRSNWKCERKEIEI